MSQFLPLNNFKWMSREDIDLLDIENIPDEGDHGYILEVDLGIFIISSFRFNFIFYFIYSINNNTTVFDFLYRYFV